MQPFTTTWARPATFATRGPSWGHLLVVLGAILSLLEPFFDVYFQILTSSLVNRLLKYPHEGPCVGTSKPRRLVHVIESGLVGRMILTTPRDDLW